MGIRRASTPIEVETTTDDGRPMVVSAAPGFTREDVLADLPAIRRSVQEALARLPGTPASD